MSITNEQIAELKGLEAAATPGPWSRVDAPWGNGDWISTGTGDPAGGKMLCSYDGWADEDDPISQSETEANFGLMAVSRNALPDLLTELERLRAAVEAAGGLCECGHVKASHTWDAYGRPVCKHGFDMCPCTRFRPATQPGEGEGR